MTKPQTLRIKHRTATAKLEVWYHPTSKAWRWRRESEAARVTVNGRTFHVFHPYTARWQTEPRPRVSSPELGGIIRPWDVPGDAREALRAVLHRAIRKWPWLRPALRRVLEWPTALLPRGPLVAVSGAIDGELPSMVANLRRRGFFAYQRDDGFIVTDVPYLQMALSSERVPTVIRVRD